MPAGLCLADGRVVPAAVLENAAGEAAPQDIIARRVPGIAPCLRVAKLEDVQSDRITGRIFEDRRWNDAADC